MAHKFGLGWVDVRTSHTTQLKYTTTNYQLLNNKVALDVLPQTASYHTILLYLMNTTEQ